jgi:hypothetical protein
LPRTKRKSFLNTLTKLEKLSDEQAAKAEREAKRQAKREARQRREDARAKAAPKRNSSRKQRT